MSLKKVCFLKENFSVEERVLFSVEALLTRESVGLGDKMDWMGRLVYDYHLAYYDSCDKGRYLRKKEVGKER